MIGEYEHSDSDDSVPELEEEFTYDRVRFLNMMDCQLASWSNGVRGPEPTERERKLVFPLLLYETGSKDALQFERDLTRWVTLKRLSDDQAMQLLCFQVRGFIALKLQVTTLRFQGWRDLLRWLISTILAEESTRADAMENSPKEIPQEEPMNPEDTLSALHHAYQLADYYRTELAVHQGLDDELQTLRQRAVEDEQAIRQMQRYKCAQDRRLTKTAAELVQKLHTCDRQRDEITSQKKTIQFLRDSLITTIGDGVEMEQEEPQQENAAPSGLMLGAE